MWLQVIKYLLSKQTAGHIILNRQWASSILQSCQWQQPPHTSRSISSQCPGEASNPMLLRYDRSSYQFFLSRGKVILRLIFNLYQLWSLRISHDIETLIWSVSGSRSTNWAGFFTLIKWLGCLCPKHSEYMVNDLCNCYVFPNNIIHE